MIKNEVTEYGRPATEKASFLIRCRVIIICDGRMLMVKKFKGATYYTLPGGRMEYDEDPVDCVKREVKEELDLNIDNLTLKYIYRWKGEAGDENIEFIFLVHNALEQSIIDQKIISNSGSHTYEVFDHTCISPDTTPIHPLAPNQVLVDFKENNFEFEGVKFVRE
jgi:8-oxo-dGTP pyrophosphatase MutT (NUDIX family)